MKYLYEKEHESGQISVRLVAYSTSPVGKEIATFELEYQRFIHSELMTHRMFSRNAMSSRAVPIEKMIEQVRVNPAMPIHWGANQKGMQADAECDELIFEGVCGHVDKKSFWKHSCAEDAANNAENLMNAGYHKQVVNRILEPYQRMKTVVTATEWDNFFELRCHKDAQPEIKVLAEMMRDALEQSTPVFLDRGDWHLPYVETQTFTEKKARLPAAYFIGDDESGYRELKIEDALKVSASCCAQVSYRMLDNSLEKAIMVYDRLVNSKPIHASPFEHQAKPLVEDFTLPYGATHVALNDKSYWSGNFQGWIQYRQLL